MELLKKQGQRLKGNVGLGGDMGGMDESPEMGDEPNSESKVSDEGLEANEF